MDKNTDVYGAFTLVHLFNTHIGKKEEEISSESDNQLMEKEESNENNKTDTINDSPNDQGKEETDKKEKTL
jgi:hypothetical protein